MDLNLLGVLHWCLLYLLLLLQWAFPCQASSWCACRYPQSSLWMHDLFIFIMVVNTYFSHLSSFPSNLVVSDLATLCGYPCPLLPVWSPWPSMLPWPLWPLVLPWPPQPHSTLGNLPILFRCVQLLSVISKLCWCDHCDTALKLSRLVIY